MTRAAIRPGAEGACSDAEGGKLLEIWHLNRRKTRPNYRFAIHAQVCIIFPASIDVGKHPLNGSSEKSRSVASFWQGLKVSRDHR